ncbi:hypothetical protein IR083_10710 [Dysgonomonas sp. GY75]|uniref:hypothetical protein n=1 Tax=Dysgonomonas sp. GY75 TaxID=2780419 RepID=UPI00188446CB|nr:hypothetical protein [Dysgonomonas sp. GY75]MBF0649291.1 hypothetical protein [Dysgonomonas sp. GY75]
MKKKVLYPYTFDRKGDTLRLTISPKNCNQLLFLGCIVLFSGLFLFHIGMLILILPILDITLKFILINSIVSLLEIFVILYFFSSYWWKRKGLEIFILYPNKLEYVLVNKPFKTEKHIFDFEKLEIRYQSGEDFYNEEEAILLGVELDLDKLVGNYPIQFYMDDGLQVVDSERRIPVEVIRKIKEEYLLNQNSHE